MILYGFRGFFPAAAGVPAELLFLLAAAIASFFFVLSLPHADCESVISSAKQAHTDTVTISILFSLAQRIDRARTVHGFSAVPCDFLRECVAQHSYTLICSAGGGGDARQNRGRSSHRGRVWHGEETHGPRGACSTFGRGHEFARVRPRLVMYAAAGGLGAGDLAHVAAVSYHFSEVLERQLLPALPREACCV